MRSIALCLAVALAAATACMAQPWEIGGAAGVGWYRDVTVANSAGTAKAGFASQASAGLVIGEDLFQHLGGEFRYTFRDGDLVLKSDSRQAGMEGQAHAFHYDLLLHATRKGSRVRPFVAGGGGIKWYIGNGRERASQPLTNFAALTRASQTEGLISFGGGVKAALASHIIFRVDFRDYVTPFPDKLFAAPKGSKESGWLHDFVPMAGFSFVF